MMTERERELLDAFVEGNESAFEELITESRERIYRTVMRIVRNHEDALDVMQDSLVKAFRKRKSFRGDSSFSTWLTSIAVREAINRVKRDRFRNAISLSLLGSRPAPEKHNPDAEAERSITEERIDAAISQLPPVQRAVFTMKFHEDYTLREIGELVGSSEGAVKASYYHAVRKLRMSLRDLRENPRERK
ncbi:MAG: RNA polymerase sigma factor [Candidatus Eisenbacteria bacterium]